MHVLLIGSGGREHALAWKLAQSPEIGDFYAAPGNPGIAAHAVCVALDVTDHAAVTAFCREKAIDLVVVGCVAAIGFTVALFVASVAFPAGPVQDAAKMGALFSFFAAVISIVVGIVTRVKKVHG